MKRLLTIAALTLLALNSPAFAGKESKHKPQNQSNKPQPIVRDHRTPNVAPVIRDHRTPNGSSLGKPQYGHYNPGYVQTNGIVQRRPAAGNNKPQVPTLTHPMSPQTPPRDPRKLTSQDLVRPGTVDQRYTPKTGSGAVVRDHRNPGGYGRQPYYGQRPVSDMSGGVKVTQTNKPGTFPIIIKSPAAVAPQLSPRGTPPVVRDHRTPVDNTIRGTGPGLHSVVDAGMNGLTKVGNVFGIGYGSVTSGAPTRPQTVDHRNR